MRICNNIDILWMRTMKLRMVSTSWDFSLVVWFKGYALYVTSNCHQQIKCSSKGISGNMLLERTDTRGDTSRAPGKSPGNMNCVLVQHSSNFNRRVNHLRVFMAMWYSVVDWGLISCYSNNSPVMATLPILRPHFK